MDIHTIVRTACLLSGASEQIATEAARHAERLVREEGAQQRAVNPRLREIAARICAAFDFSRPPTRRMTATEVCRAIGIENPTRADAMMCSEAIQDVTLRPASKSNGQKVNYMPPLKTG